MTERKTKVRLLQSFAGDLAGYESPSVGAVLDLPSDLATALADGERAELVDEGGKKKRREAAAFAGGPEKEVIEPEMKHG
jgi:hypothetical protein